MTSAASRVCSFCKREAAADAAKCPHCQEWSQEVKSARNRAWSWSLASALALAVGLVLKDLLTPQMLLPTYAALGAFVLLAGVLCVVNCVIYSRRTGNWFWV